MTSHNQLAPIGFSEDAEGCSPTVLPLYRRVLGVKWDALPPALRALHDVRSVHEFVGRADVEGAHGVLAWVIARVIGFPEPGFDIPVHVQLETDGMRETWTRTFGTYSFRSIQEQGQDRNAGLLVERFGGFAFGLDVVIANETLELHMKHWSFFGVPLPLGLAPRSNAQESEVDSRFRFDVDISVPLVGRIVRYTGVLHAITHPPERF